MKLASASLYTETPSSLLPRRDIFEHPTSYQEEKEQCRYFYQYDPIASSVINRMVSLASTPVYNLRLGAGDKEMAVYTNVAEIINTILPSVFTTYLVDGMAVIDFTLHRVPLQKINPKLGRLFVHTLKTVWVRNNDTIKLKKVPTSPDYDAYYVVPEQEREIILHKGKLPDGSDYTDVYRQLLTMFPDYVSMVRKGETLIKLSTWPMLRNMVSFRENPQPFLVPALAPLKQKAKIVQMDYQLASRALEAVRHVRVGNDTYPVTDGDTTIDDLRTQLQHRPHTGVETVYTLVTNHTVDIKWVYPPLDALLSADKYVEVNNSIMTALGFSRMLLVGEAQRSNSGGRMSSVGIVASIEQMRRDFLSWLQRLYAHIASLNRFSVIPKPVFRPIPYEEYVAFLRALTDIIDKGMVDKTLVQEYLAYDNTPPPVTNPGIVSGAAGIASGEVSEE